MTAEQKTSQAILQQPVKVQVGGKEYTMAKPTVATIIMVSEIVSQLPNVIESDETDIQFVLKKARDMKMIGRMIAVLILGAKAAMESENTGFMGKVFGHKSKVDKLADELLQQLEVKELCNIVIELIKHLDVGFFFGTIISLTKVNVLKPTKTGNPTTASGQ